ncbi:TonB-dependent receptor plug domain-containing protein [Sphingomonas morindae]|uniref:TonB-dependent receptor n=1 Tax=Sphingomonas morindae TaxID=1541170 RepID=A0ABY4X4B7_9SPHN|nr:TonB-dependent receptor [Sphingomonas morindae]USI71687.1 TonB-dependent receptor [Sphingomonas morindae]
MPRVSCCLGVAAALLLPSGAGMAQIVDHAALEATLGETVTTSVTGSPERASDAPASLTIISHEEIARSPARSVPDLLKAYAGVEVTRWTAGQSDVAVRGGVQTYNARLLVLVDGRQVYLDHYGMTDWNLLGIQLEDIQQIELVRGPASALFGFNAADGVVNIITRNALGDRSAAITAEGGTHGYGRVAGSLILPLADRLGLRLSGGHQREDERAIPDRFYAPPTIPATTADQAAATLAFAPDGATRIELNGGWAANRQLEFLPSQILTVQRFQSETAGVLVDHDTPLGSLTGHGYVNWLNADYGVTTPPDSPFGAVAALRARNRTAVLDGAALIRLTDVNTLRIEGEYRNNQLHSGRLFSPRIGYQIAAASGMLDLHPTDHIGLTLAARVDHSWLDQGGAAVLPQIDMASAYHRAFTQASFNLAVTARIGSAGQLRVNGGKGVQSPSLISYGLRVMVPADDTPVPVFLSGDPRLRPVAVWSGEIGYNQRIGGLTVDAGVFYNHTAHAIASPGDPIELSFVLSPTPAAFARFANVGSFDTYGLALSASGRLLQRLGWKVNYSWLGVDQDLPADRTPYTYALSPRLTTPRHVANLSLDYQRGRWSLSALGHYASATRQFAFDPATSLLVVGVPGAVTLDAKSGFVVSPHLTAYVAGENLGAARGAYGSPIPADRRVRGGVSIRL